MSEKTYQTIVAERTRQEISEFDGDRRAQLQRELDFWMERRLIGRVTARPGELPARGEYDPFSRERMNS